MGKLVGTGIGASQFNIWQLTDAILPPIMEIMSGRLSATFDERYAELLGQLTKSDVAASAGLLTDSSVSAKLPYPPPEALALSAQTFSACFAAPGLAAAEGAAFAARDIASRVQAHMAVEWETTEAE